MIVSLPGVFRPVSDAELLIGEVRREVAGGARDVVDVCTGSGVVAVAAALKGADVVAIDVSRRALVCARLNALLAGATLRVRRGDLFAPLRGRRVDLITANPPYIPTAAPDALPPRGVARAWEAGHDGRMLIDRVCAEAPRHLRPGGALLMVHSSLCDIDASLVALRDAGLDPHVASRQRGPLGPIVRARASALQARGVLAPGQNEEDIVVIRARA
ncbi:MAG: HemK2/MTQ2 family protein methyltransferase [Solirubrobacteraceae bacterium]